MKTVKVTETFTLSSYEAEEYGTGHIVDGKKPKNPSFAESLAPLHCMVGKFKDLPTGTKIKVTMEAING
jgi:hypothetical protein